MHSFWCIISLFFHILCGFHVSYISWSDQLEGKHYCLAEKEIEYIKYLNTVENKYFMYMIAQLGRL